jgi:ethanolamine ammonia-lyase large subunit
MEIGMIEEVYEVKDYRDALAAIAEMRGGLNVARGVARSRSERELVDYLLQLIEAFEIMINSMPPAGKYAKV